MMHVSGHKTQKTFMDYIKLSSEEIADEIARNRRHVQERERYVVRILYLIFQP